MAKKKRTLDDIQSMTDEQVRAVEQELITETTGDHAKDPAEEVTDADS